MRLLTFAIVVAVVWNTPALSDESCQNPISSDEKAALSQFLDGQLRDEPSTRYANLCHFNPTVGGNAGHDVICGRLNTKNGYGAYTGWSPFYLDVTAKKLDIIERSSTGNSVLDDGLLAAKQIIICSLCINTKEDIPTCEKTYN